MLCAGVLAGVCAALVGPTPAPAARSAPRPTVTITRAPRAITTVRHGSISFTVANARRVECSIDGGVFRRCASPFAYKRLALGAHTVVVRAKSRLRTVAASRRFVVVAAPREALVPWPTVVAPFTPPSAVRPEVAAP